ncbi:hypothetical protein [Halobacterium litoreum]|uniref:Restriction endonuclease n=1 Tax=Halobacterium litoreum TaxID=2039234 RepID=A0ABD5NBF9_9EURY|nr:hypothetical protein [Halobacterium litoreum]UHH14643.1 hypothetical protein LT972_06495 [Halobacterium litoreum]
MSDADERARLGAFGDEAFEEFVAALWRRAGWRVASADGPPFDAARSEGRRATVLVPMAPSAGEVSAARMRDVVAEREGDASDLTAVSPVGFSVEALDVADAHGVDAVGPDSLLRLVDALDADHLLADPA